MSENAKLFASVLVVAGVFGWQYRAAGGLAWPWSEAQIRAIVRDEIQKGRAP